MLSSPRRASQSRGSPSCRSVGCQPCHRGSGCSSGELAARGAKCARGRGCGLIKEVYNIARSVFTEPLQLQLCQCLKVQAVNPRARVEHEHIRARDGKGRREEMVGCVCCWAQAACPLPPALPEHLPASASAAGERVV